MFKCTILIFCNFFQKTLAYKSTKFKAINFTALILIYEKSELKVVGLT